MMGTIRSFRFYKHGNYYAVAVFIGAIVGIYVSIANHIHLYLVSRKRTVDNELH